MLDYLTRTGGSPLVYLLKAWATICAGTIIMVFVGSQIVPEQEPTGGATDATSLVPVLLLFWPLLATGLIHLALIPAKIFAPTYWYAAGGTALGFALILGLMGGPVVGIVYAWPFFVFAVTFLAWQLKSGMHAWIMTTLLHAMVNLPVVLLL